MSRPGFLLFPFRGADAKSNDIPASIPVAFWAIAFALGLLLIPFGAETRGQALQA